MRSWAVLLAGAIGCGAPPECELVPDPGDCDAYFVRYYYDAELGECGEFVWGGCEGVVPFESWLECDATCAR